MATSSVGSVQGLASGIQWQDMVTQIMQLETTRQLTPLSDKQTAAQASVDAWNSYATTVGQLNTAAQALRDGTSFGNVQVAEPNSPTTSRTLFTATGTANTAPGSYSVGVLSLAAAQKLSGNVVTDSTAALGNSGQFLVSGQAVTVVAGDSLNAVRDKINALNSGTAPTRVSASILMAGTSNARLVLTSDVGGSGGVDLRDARGAPGAPSLIQQLGFFDGTTSNVGTDGVVRSALFSSSSAKVSALAVGVTSLPSAAAITVNGAAVSIDVQNQSLADIAAAINAVSPNSASVETVTNDTTTSYRLNISGTVVGDANAQPTLELLGLVKGTTGVVQQQVHTSNVLQDAGGGAVSGSSLLLGLKNAGGIGAAMGDTFTITGTKADGVTRVNLSETVDGTRTVNDMLTDLSTAFSAAGRHVTASLSGGQIRLTDDAGGDSGISFSMSSNNESAIAAPLTGSTLSFGAAATDVVGRARELAQGSDARITVNGVTMVRSSNTISDAITGLTLNLQAAEAGTVIPLTVTRDTSQTVTAVQNLAAAYNAVKSFVDKNTATGGPLAFNGALRASMASIKQVLLSDVQGLPSGSPYTSAPLVGVAFDKTGVLQVDAQALTTALTQNADAVKSLFSTNALVTGSNLNYLSSSTKTQAGRYTTNITQAATQSLTAGSTANYVYADGGNTDTMTIVDAATAGTGNIQLVSGDTVDTTVAKLNGLFSTKSMQLVAKNVAGHLQIATLGYGAARSFTVSYGSTGVSDVAGQIGIAAGAYANGLDVAGNFMFGGIQYAATGSGQVLTGAFGTPGEGLGVQYTGTGNIATGTIDFSSGMGGMMANIGDLISRAGDGIVAQQTTANQSTIDRLVSRQTDIQGRLDQQKATLTAQFVAMESAMSKLQAQGNYLTSQLNALNPTSK